MTPAPDSATSSGSARASGTTPGSASDNAAHTASTTHPRSRARSESNATAPVVTRLREVGIEVDPSERRTSEYAYDASNYRVRPLAVVFPRTMDDVVATVRACSATHTPIVSRGGGTAMAGNAVGRGVVVDF